MRLLTILLLISLPLVAKDLYKVCVSSQTGQGCTKVTFDKKTALQIRDIIGQAPIPAEYEVWVIDAKTNMPVAGPNDKEPVLPASHPQIKEDKI